MNIVTRLITCIVIELLIITQILHVFNITVNNAKHEGLIGEWRLTERKESCWYASQWYFFKIENCQELQIGEKYQLFGTVTEVSDTLFFKQIRLKVTAKLVSENGKNSVNTWLGNLYRFRATITTQVRSLLEENLRGDEVGVILGLLFGDASTLSDARSQDLKTAGLQHIIAASGYNISLVIGVLLPLFRRLLSGRKLWAGVITGVWFFIFMAAAGPSLLRAGMTATWAVLSTWGVFRSARAWWSTCLAVVTLTVFNPYLWWSISFQLSLAATLGLLLFSGITPRGNSLAQAWIGLGQQRIEPQHQSWSKKILLYTRENLIASVATLSLVFPLLLYHFQSFSPLSLPATVGVMWLIPLASFSGVMILIVSTLLSGTYLWLLISYWLRLPIVLLLDLIQMWGKAEWAVISGSNISSAHVILWWAGVAVLLRLLMWRRQRLASSDWLERV